MRSMAIWARDEQLQVPGRYSGAARRETVRGLTETKAPFPQQRQLMDELTDQLTN